MIELTGKQVLALMKSTATRVAELGTAVEMAMGAQTVTADDLAAVMTAAQISKQLADEFRAATAGESKRDLQASIEFDKGLRRWSMGCRLISDGLGGPSPALLAIGRGNYELGAREIAAAIKRLS